MARPRTRKSAELAPPPPSVDWDFETVPEKELEACALWEYARESDWIRSIKQRCEDPAVWEMTNLPAREFVGLDIERMQTCWEANHVLCRGLFSGNPSSNTDEQGNRLPVRLERPALCFPCPWQRLPREERTRRSAIPELRDVIKAPPFGRGYWEAITDMVMCRRIAAESGSLLNSERPGWAAGLSISCAGSETGLFSIAWELYTNEEICAAFKTWVQQNRPPDSPSPKRRGHRRHDFLVALRRLAMMRLLHLCPLTEMEAWCPGAWKLYKNYSWHQERTRARAAFRKLLYFVPHAENPRCWPTAAHGEESR